MRVCGQKLIPRILHQPRQIRIPRRQEGRVFPGKRMGARFEEATGDAGTSKGEGIGYCPRNCRPRGGGCGAMSVGWRGAVGMDTMERSHNRTAVAACIYCLEAIQSICRCHGPVREIQPGCHGMVRVQCIVPPCPYTHIASRSPSRASPCLAKTSY